MGSERVEWVEIIEPKTKEHMYANLTTGECVWDPPEGVNVKRTDSSQWWELFDSNTHRFYYYNATTQSTVWHRPVDCDIIPLAKLQTLKQNTDPQQRRESATQTQIAQAVPQICNQWSEARACVANGVGSGGAGRQQTSPGLHARRSHHHHRCGGEARRGREGGAPACRHTDSGRSSDSSISSAQQHRLQDPNLALALGRAAPGPQTPSPAAGGQPGPRARGPPSTGANDVPDKWPPQTGLNRSGSFMSPRKDASDDSMHEKYFKSVESTPLTRRKLQQAAGSSGDSASPQSPSSPQARVLRTPLLQPSSARPSLVSCMGPGPGMALGPGEVSGPAARPERGALHSLERGVGSRARPLDRNARERFSDRNLDKERILELERNLERNYPDKLSGPEKPFRQTSLDLRHQSSHQSKEFSRRQQAEPERFNASKQLSVAGTPMCAAAGLRLRTQASADASLASRTAQPQEPSPSSGPVMGFGLKSLSLEPPLTKPNLERHNRRLEGRRSGAPGGAVAEEVRTRGSGRRRTKGTTSKRHRQRQAEDSGDDVLGGAEDEGDDDGASSPLYSNWDLRAMPHLLPLQHYIMEQAKMSGCYRFGDPLAGAESDSLQSGSGGSESGASGSRSLSGHEPDNESSEGAGRSDDGDYLPHACYVPSVAANPALDDEYMNHDVAYYNTFVGFTRDNQPPAGIQRAQSAGGGLAPGGPGGTGGTREQPLYSPVRAHPSPAPPAQPAPLEQDIEKFARDNLNLKAKGIFRKKASVQDMLSWTASSISAPMLGVRWDKAHKRAATQLFRLVQVYMGDRKARPGMTLNSVAQDILHAAYSDVTLRDELYVQLCRQTTENPQRDSLLRGWELLAVCLAFVPPSTSFQPALHGYVARHRDPDFADAFPEVGKWPIHVQVSHYAGVAGRRLERIGCAGKRQPRKPSTEDIDQARIQIFRQSMFGNTLDEVMALQRDRFPNRQLPWAQVALSQQVLALQGRQTEGIFRVSADVDEVNMLKARIDNWELPDQNQLTDAHAPASLLKLWYRELYEPLIPDALYGACVAAGGDALAAARLLQRLPPLNRLVLTYLVSFLQEFASPEVVSQTKMDSANLAMVFAPNCLRCTSPDPRVILDNARREMTFMRCLITSMDTSHVKDLL